MPPQPPTSAPRLRRFRVDVGTIISAVVLVQSLLLVALGYWGAQRLVSTIGESAHHADHARIEDKTIAYLAKAASVVEAIGDSPSLQVSGEGKAQTAELLWTLLQQSPELDSLYAANTDGDMMMARRHPAPAVRHVTVAPEGSTETWQYKPMAGGTGGTQLRYRTERIEAFRSTYDARKRVWFQSALGSHGAAVWTPPYMYATVTELGVTYALPALRQDASGRSQSLVAAGDVTLGRLSDFVRQFSRTGYGDSALLSADFAVLARSDVEGKLDKLESPSTGVLAVIYTTMLADGSAHAMGRAAFGLDHEGRRYLVQTSRIPATGWLLISWVPEDKILGGLRRAVLWSLMLVLVSLGIILFVSLRLSKLITAPVENLAGIARRIGRFDLDELPRVDSRVLEIHHLDQALDESARGLKAFSKFVPVDVVNQLIDEGHTLTPSGGPRRITVMFSDVEGFTSISEATDSQVLVDQLTEYFNVATRVINWHGGTVDKFIGDGIMVLWGAPAELEDAEHQACLAAIELQNKLDTLNERWAARGLHRFHTRVGIHTGVAVVGVLGSNNRLSYTAFGDAINVASRIEGINKELGTRILLSEATFEGLRGRLHTRRIDAVELRGRQQKLVLYELVGR